MKEELKNECERVIKGRTFWIALAIGTVIMLVQFIVETVPASFSPLETFDNSYKAYPATVFKYWFGGRYASPYVTTFLMILPILATLPYALTYHMDLKSGYVKNVYTRTKRSYYLVAKYLVTFVSAGIAVVLPCLINLLLTACVLPSLIPVNNSLYPLNGTRVLVDVYYSHPYCYIFIYMLFYFLYAGAFAVVGLAVTQIVDNVFLLMITPFVMYYGLEVISPYVSKICNIGRLNPIAQLDMTQPVFGTIKGIITIPILFLTISTVLYFRNGVKRDAL